MVDLLVSVHLSQEVGRDREIVPGHIPLFIELLVATAMTNSSILILSIPAQLVREELAGYFLDRIVLGAIDIHY